jgi:hypothetical protein
MSHILDVPFSQGYVSTGESARSAYDLEPGELVTMKGAFYRKNDSKQPFKMLGRSEFGDTGSTGVLGLAICQFDSGGTDKLLASISTKIVAATPGATGTFADLITGLNASATRFTACHQDDRWYLGNGYDINKVLKPDGTTRDMGLPTPQTLLTAATSSTAGSRAAPTASTGSFLNAANAYDASGDATFSSGSLSTVTSVTHTFSTWAADATASRTLQWRWSLAGLQIESNVDHWAGTIGTGGTIDAGFRVTILFEYYNGTAWVTALTQTRRNATSGIQPATWPILDAINSSLVQFRVTMTYTSGTNAATLRLYDVAIQAGSTVTPITTTGTMYYAYSWYDSTEDDGAARSGEGAPSDFVPVAVFASQRSVLLTRVETAPTVATHWKIYRTVPGAARSIDNLGLLATVPVASLTYTDTFNDSAGLVDPTVQLLPLVAAMVIGDLSIPRDTQPPAFVSMVSWKGSVCGISRTNRRAWRYSEAGKPESWPEFYVVTSFPLEEHDGLVGQMPVGETMVLLCEGAVLAVDDTPRVIDGQFNGADARPLKGHPGCVGSYAFTTFSVAGEPRGAWVSPFGVYITNGQTCDPISDDLAWETEVNVPYLGTSVLRWDAKNLILWFEFDLDGDGQNDHEMPFHMAQMHDKGSNRPKLGQPTAKATSCMASALISADYYRFSGHPSNGEVYVEESGTTDAATGSEVEMILRSGKITNRKTDVGIVKATVIHGDFGLGEEATLTTTLYRDSANSSNSRTNTVSLYGHRGTTVAIMRAAEAFDFQLQYSGTGTGGILGIQAEAEGHGRSGSATRWASASVTP